MGPAGRSRNSGRKRNDLARIGFLFGCAKFGGDCGAAALVAHSVVVCQIPPLARLALKVARQLQLGTVTVLECKIPRFVGRPFEL